MRSKAVVLLSGGLDSAVTLYFARSLGYQCFCLIFDYGQRHRREIQSAKRIAKSANCPFKILKISLPWKGSSLLDSHKRLPISNYRASMAIPSTYVPARNIIFLSFAISYAETIGAKTVFIGAHVQDYSGYPDCRPEFFRVFKKVISCGTKTGTGNNTIKINTPLIKKNKAEIIKLGDRLGVPFVLTWSCYQGGRRPCARCQSCRFRAKGFKEAGLKDPLQ
ncbi:MAG: 7-cyano-7-deazaguanine synthase QueC [Candidatus Omnitrophica bacterium]|nr:7-cyano-7-deazaguanine synthase QueC [Candidatus Omnitrophota bacterium]